MTTGCLQTGGSGVTASVLRAIPGLDSGYHGGMRGHSASVQRHPLDTALCQAVGATSPHLPSSPNLGSSRDWQGRALPTHIVILGRVARGRPEEVLRDPALREPVDLATLSATCASRPPHPKVLTWGGKKRGLLGQRCSQEGIPEGLMGTP